MNIGNNVYLVTSLDEAPISAKISVGDVCIVGREVYAWDGEKWLSHAPIGTPLDDGTKFNSAYEKYAHIQATYDKMYECMDTMSKGLDSIWRHTKMGALVVATNRTNGVRCDAEMIIKLANELIAICEKEVKS